MWHLRLFRKRQKAAAEFMEQVDAARRAAEAKDYDAASAHSKAATEIAKREQRSGNNQRF